MTELSIGPVRFGAGLRIGEPIPLRDGTLTPRALAFTARWPGGGWFHNTPVDFTVQRTGQAATRHWVVDGTRLLLVALGIFTAMTGTSAARAELKRRIDRG
jgi:hypothetical protein